VHSWKEGKCDFQRVEAAGDIYRRCYRGVERVANGRFGGRENDFVLMGLSHAEVCRFAGL